MQPSAWTIQRHASVTSTMDAAKELARNGAPDGTVVVAEEMTAGRGTHGRAWHSPKGGLYLSFVIRGVDDPHLLTLALGNAVADALEVAGIEPQLKWVNDIWARGKKVAGILVEAESTGSKIDFLVAGIGINVNGAPESFPPALQGHATTLEAELGCDSCIPDLETLVLADVDRALRQVREGRSQEILDAFRRRDGLKGSAVVVEDGKSEARGVAEGVDDKGRLMVRTATGVAAFANGTVRLETKAAAGLERT